MANNNAENGWNEYSRLVLKELETLADGMESLRTELQEVRRDILRLETKETKVDDIKAWKEKVDEVFSTTQMKELRDKVTELESFKTKASTIFFVAQFLMAGIAVALQVILQKYFS